MIKLENLLNEALPVLIPEYPVNIAGQSMTLRFDTNVNKTKKGVKLQFVMSQIPQDPRELQRLTNEIGAELQEKFGGQGLQIINDLENPYKNVIGFLLPLPSISSFVMKSVMGADSDQLDQEPRPEQEPEQEEDEFKPEPLPATEQPPAPEDGQPLKEGIKERMKRIAGL